MAFDFPSAPTIGQVYNGYVWDGTAWQGQGGIPGAVRYDVLQALTAAQQLQARQNIGAAPLDAMMHGGIQVNGNADLSQELGSTGFTSTVATAGYACDCWQTCINQGAGAINFTGMQLTGAGFPVGYKTGVMARINNGNFNLATSGDSIHFRQAIEGYRMARLGWGAANAHPISYAFWLLAPIAGTIFTRLYNADINRFYYTEHVVAAGWNWVTATVPGDTSGTWGVWSGVGLYFDISVGGKETTPAAPSLGTWGTALKWQTTGSTNLMGTANYYCVVTGFLVLPGTELPSMLRSPFIMRSLDQELVAVKRYWQQHPNFWVQTSAVGSYLTFPVQFRAQPTMTGGGVGLVFTYINTINAAMYQNVAAYQTLNFNSRMM